MKQLENASLLVNESLFATANGYIGVRGNFEEGYPEDYETYQGTYLNGFFDTHVIKYSESAFGFPEIGETIVNVLDGQQLIVEIEGDSFSLFQGTVLSLERKLDLDKGYSLRKVHWLSPKGHELILTFRRMTSFVMQELFVIDLDISSVNYSGDILIKSYVSGDVKRLRDNDDPRVTTEHVKPLTIEKITINDELMLIKAKTHRSQSEVVLSCQHSIKGEIEQVGNSLLYSSCLKIKSGESISISKYMIYTDSHKHNMPEEEAVRLLKLSYKKGRHQLFAEQLEYMNNFWSSCDVEVIDEADLTYAIRFSQYQLLAAAGRDGISQVAAKGLTGAGYEGHYFWDTEIYVIPFFTLTNPELAKSILKYRYNILEASKERSLQLGHKSGAKIPWRTISGRECSSYFPAGTAQYHINADVAYGYIQYYLLTDDDEMMQSFGYELLVETAKLWLEVGHYKNDEFCIDAVTGPDEYSAVVNNNYYTNAMAKYHLEWTVKLYKSFGSFINVDETLINEMALAAQKMRLPFDKELGIHKQDDNFLNKKVWDFESTPKENYPLLLNYHPLTIYRHQVLKQADTVLAHFLLDDTTDDIMAKSYNYYENITTHDSSLSPCVYGMMASRINKPDIAYDFFKKTVYLDLDDLHHNTKDGIHIANAGGTYMAMVYGFAGLRIKEDGLHLKPTKPNEWTGYSFKFIYKNALVKVTVKDTLTIETNHVITLFVDGRSIEITDKLEVQYIGKH